MNTPKITVKLQERRKRTKAQMDYATGNTQDLELLLKRDVMGKLSGKRSGKLFRQWYFIPYRESDLLIHKSRTDLIEVV